MNKKILIISALILILVVALTACKGKTDDIQENETDKVIGSVTVTGQDGGITNVEIFEDASGDRYITNVDGDKIPLTTDKSGFADDIGYLVTKPSQTVAPSSSAPAGEDKPAPSSAPSGSTEEPSGGLMIIDEDDTDHQDKISIDDLKK